MRCHIIDSQAFPLGPSFGSFFFFHRRWNKDIQGQSQGNAATKDKDGGRDGRRLNSCGQCL